MTTSKAANDASAVALPSVEIGFVSKDSELRDFFETVFRFEAQDAIHLPIGALYPLRGDGTVIKIFVPESEPQPNPKSDMFFGIAGIRFLTIRVTDIDGVIERAAANGARILREPYDSVPGVRSAMIEDPDGNTIEVSQGKSA